MARLDTNRHCPRLEARHTAHHKSAGQHFERQSITNNMNDNNTCTTGAIAPINYTKNEQQEDSKHFRRKPRLKSAAKTRQISSLTLRPSLMMFVLSLISSQLVDRSVKCQLQASSSFFIPMEVPQNGMVLMMVTPSNGPPKQLAIESPLPSGSVAIQRRSEVIVPGSGALLREPGRVDQIILPSDDFYATINSSFDLTRSSYVIDHKRFVESVTTRCLASTILEDPDSVEPSFIIIKPNSEMRINATAPLELIQLAGFEPSKPTTLIVHGFTQSYPNTDWLRRVRALFEVNSFISKRNLIIMDWGVASHGSYSQVAAMVSGMGSFLANFLMKLIELGTDRMSIHIIGHSLGAHLAGFAGKRLRPRLGRITALDPAGPCFGKLLSNSPSDRLSPDDAYEVDVYHYDDSFLGLPGQIGQFDVYVNGGSSQPGAKDNVNSMFQALITMVFRRNRALSESHTRSTEVSTTQLAPGGCQQVAFECRDWPSFMAGECGRCDDLNTQCFFMGFQFQYADHMLESMPLRTSFPGKRLFIATSANEQYCLQHHQILIKFEPHPEIGVQAKRNRWRLYLELVNERGERLNATVTNQMAPNVFSYLLLTESRPTRFKSAVLQVRHSDGSLMPLRERAKSGKSVSFRANNIEVNFMSHVNPNFRRALSSRLCPSGWLGAPQSGAYNSIADSSLADEWLAFDECNLAAH